MMLLTSIVCLAGVSSASALQQHSTLLPAQSQGLVQPLEDAAVSGAPSPTGDVAQAPTENAPPLQLGDVFLFGGQSNCVGMGQAKDLSGSLASYLVTPPNMIGRPVPIGKRSQDWTPFHVRADAVDVNFGNPAGEFGPELSFGKQIAGLYSSDENFGVIKSAKSGSGMASKWLNASRNPNLLSILINRAKVAQNAPECKGGRCSVKALIWVQGEEDTHHEEASAQYKDNLHTLVQRIRDELQEPTLFVIVVELPREGAISRQVYADVVRQAQNDFVAEQGPNLAALVSTDGIEKYPTDSKIGDLHYNSEGLIILGERLASAYMERFYPGRA